MGGIRGAIVRQFGKPDGALGVLVGWAMAAKNRPRNDWMLARLAIRPTDHVLEIGCGPGYALGKARDSVPLGAVAAIDHSPLMVRQALARLRKQRVSTPYEVRVASSDRLPWPPGHFDVVFMSNVSLFWGEPARHFAEIRRVLKPGGRLGVTLQPPGKAASQIHDIAAALSGQIAGAGFTIMERDARMLRGGPCILLLATR